MSGDVNVAAAPMSSLDRARAERAGADQARRVVRSKLVGLRSLFGDAVGRAIESALEPHEERCEDTFRSYEDAIAAERRVARDAIERLQQNHEVIAGQNEKIDRLSADLVARYQRGRRPVPEWLADIRADFEAPF